MNVDEIAAGLPARFLAEPTPDYFFGFWAWPAGLPGLEEGEEPDHVGARGLDHDAVGAWEEAAAGAISALPRLLILALHVAQQNGELGAYARDTLGAIDIETLRRPIPVAPSEEEEEEGDDDRP